MKIVVKLGGELLAEARASQLVAITSSIAGFIEAGHRVIVVHGGGPQTTALQKALGQEPNIVGGRRVTDEAALTAIEMMVGGRLNIELTSALRRAGVDAVGLNGVSGRLIACERRPPRVVSGGGDRPVDFGFVGDVTGVNEALLALLLDAGHVPVIACIGSDEGGQAYNINADVVANGLAAAVGADRLLLVTSTPGVLRDKDDPSTRITTMTVAEGRAAIADGTVQGGMIPKLEESFAALERGVGEIHILGDVKAGDLERVLERPGEIGTALLSG
ncbi:MAG: acetylglutamate kinase [Deltaproteobacteria bacterium]